MQGHTTYFPAVGVKWNRQTFTMLIVVGVLLLLGAGIGYMAARSAVSEATLNIQVENAASTTQTVRILVNGNQVGQLTLAPDAFGTFAWRVGWTNSQNGVYEVRAEPTSGVSDSSRVTVMNGETAQIDLRVR